MPIFIGGQHIVARGKDEPDPITIQRQEEVEPTIEAKREKVATLPPKTRTVANNNLIDYKQSSFISDMLQSNKD